MFSTLYIFSEKKEVSDDQSEMKRKRLTFREFAAECLGFYLGAHETSASTAAFCLAELSLQEDIQDRVREEIQQVVHRHNGELSFEAIAEMTYMDQVIKGKRIRLGLKEFGIWRANSRGSPILY